MVTLGQVFPADGGLTGKLRPDDDRDADRVLALGWDQLSHEVEQIRSEERVEGEIVDSHGGAFEHIYVAEAGGLELGDEVTLRQRAGHSPGPSRRVGEDFRWQLLLIDCEIRHGQPTSGPEDAGAFGEDARLAWGEVDDAV